MIAMQMLEIMERSISKGSQPLGWKMRDNTLIKLKRQSRHTGDIKVLDGRITFLDVPVEIFDVRNSLGAELVTRSPVR